MAQPQHTPAPPSLEEAIIVLFCLVDDAYASLTPRGDCYGALKKLMTATLAPGLRFVRLPLAYSCVTA